MFGLPGNMTGPFIVADIRAGEDGWFNVVDEKDPRYFSRLLNATDLGHYTFTVLARDVPVPPRP